MDEVVEPTFRSSVTRLVGDEARAWLNALPVLESEIAKQWSLELGPELPGGFRASVRVVRRTDDTDAVLKLAGPWDRTADEIACLRLWGGGPAPMLIEADPERGALLLERIVPADRATDADPEQVAMLLDALHVPDELGLRPLHGTVSRRLDHAERDGRASGQRLAWARTAVERLHDEPPSTVVVHGGFDERNLLVCAKRGICTIDPLPCSGDGTYDAACWVHANRRAGRRARFEAIVAAAELDRERLKDWCGVVAVHG